jgi:dTDP-4-dehydrorhamnose 3,5-epimerase
MLIHLENKKLKKVKVFQSLPFKDHRGELWTSWEFKKIKKNLIHDKFSLSKKNVLRGFHGDNKTWKLISCVYGKILFVVVDYNSKSKDFLKHQSFVLSDKNRKNILIPPYYLNAHLCLSKECLFHYKLSYKGKYNDTNNQLSVPWNDPRIKIKWPIKNPILSSRDKKNA